MRVAILGCGYVGLELGDRIQSNGHEVIGVRRSAEGCERIQDRGLTAIRGDLTDPEILQEIPDCSAVVFAASSGGRGAEAARAIYVEGLKRVIEHFGNRSEPPDRLVYTSSTGVYGDHGGDWVDEQTPIDPTTDKTAILAKAETIALEAAQNAEMTGTVARLAGLYGPGRYRLERYLEGPVVEGYLNMVHRDDAAGAIAHLLTTDQARGDVVLLVDDEPVEKWAFADWLANAVNRDPPAKETVAQRLARKDLSKPAKRRLRTSKRCQNDWIRSLGYEFEFPTFRDGYRPAITDHLGGPSTEID